jgi:NADH-quinone oxidoreductase subunit M
MVVLAATGVVLGAIYMLWMYQRVFFGKLDNEKNKTLQDMSWREMAVLIPIVVFIFWLGVRPGLILDRVEASINEVLKPLIENVQPGPDSHHSRVVASEPATTITPVFLVQDTESH